MSGWFFQWKQRGSLFLSLPQLFTVYYRKKAIQDYIVAKHICASLNFH
ncbi:hypothetical protein MNV_370024 [Candidatus Methanoperedens nitroreducens]|uniref:Uncharacterized protein n=1 Tax=Candidatus Methanoperedens nitratireducens TaxID=1392998 RepID=A0A284VQE7_9EURY|nr:hypothetical protein MNV_370024 [Candidatus Methanoperedens nitroreducens]